MTPDQQAAKRERQLREYLRCEENNKPDTKNKYSAGRYVLTLFYYFLHG